MKSITEIRMTKYLREDVWPTHVTGICRHLSFEIDTTVSGVLISFTLKKSNFRPSKTTYYVIFTFSLLNLRPQKI